MQLIGMLDSPYVRRVAVTLEFLGLPWVHRPLSVFGDFDAIRSIHPLAKVPTLVLDDGEALIDSTLILEHLDTLDAPNPGLLVPEGKHALRSRQLLGVALAALEKTVLLIYERHQRPPERQHEPWLERNLTQLTGACDWLETAVGDGERWLFGERPSQADVTLAIAWRFVQLRSSGDIPADRHPALRMFSRRAETLPAFLACPVE